MNNLKTFNNLHNNSIALMLGFIGGILSLIILATTSSFINLSAPTVQNIFINSLTEEAVKFLLLLFILQNIKIILFKNLYQKITFGFFFGCGFALLEIIIALFFHQHDTTLSSIINPLFVHIFSGIIITIANSQKKLSTTNVIYFAIAFFIHICYNLSVLYLHNLS